jgi:hypothetical protein
MPYRPEQWRDVEGYNYQPYSWPASPYPPRHGMGDLWSNITGAVNLGQAGLAFYGQYQQLQAITKATGQQGQQLQQQFDNACLAAEQLFHAIQIKPVGTVTQDDFTAAQQAYGNLDAIAAQYQSLQSLWNSASYKPAFQNGLANIQAMAAQAGNVLTPAGVQTIPQAGSLNIGGMQIPTWALMAVAAFFLLKR